MRRTMLALIVGAAALGGCTDSRHDRAIDLMTAGAQRAPTADAEAPPPPVLATPATMPVIADGRARIVVYLGRRDVRVGFRPELLIDGTQRGQLVPGEARYVDVAPGVVRVALDTWTAASVSVSVREGETGYVRVDQRFSGAASPVLRSIAPEEGKQAAESLTAVAATR